MLQMLFTNFKYTNFNLGGICFIAFFIRGERKVLFSNANSINLLLIILYKKNYLQKQVTFFYVLYIHLNNSLLI